MQNEYEFQQYFYDFLAGTAKGVFNSAWQQVAIGPVSLALQVDKAIVGDYRRTSVDDALDLLSNPFRYSSHNQAIFGAFSGGATDVVGAYVGSTNAIRGAGQAYKEGELAAAKRGGCFVAGTPVSMADGSFKPIEQIKAGDVVLSRKPNAEGNAKVEAKTVTNRFVHVHPATVSLTLLDGEMIETTPEHPFYVAGEGFVPAGRLSIGNAIVTRAGPSALVISVTPNTAPKTVYNFTVESDHTYFVGKNGGGLWVHNVDCFSKEEQATADYLSGLGRKVSKNPLEGVAGAGRQGDAYVDGLLHEFKTLDAGATSSTIRNVVNNSIRRGGQARNIVIDARGTRLPLADAQEGIRRALGISRGKVDRITVIGKDYLWGAGR